MDNANQIRRAHPICNFIFMQFDIYLGNVIMLLGYSKLLATIDVAILFA
jgi:hypothetical protein